jgi:hypothetical protein
MKIARLLMLALAAGPALVAGPSFPTFSFRLPSPAHQSLSARAMPAPGDLSLISDQAPVSLPAYYVRPSSPEPNLWEIEAAMAQGPLLAPCALFTRDLYHAQIQALEAPIAPLPVEPKESQLQARFPIITLAW